MVCADRIGANITRKPAVSGLEYELLTDLEAEPVTLSDFKAHCRIDYNVDDRLLEIYLKASRQHLEKVAQLSFGERKVRMTALTMVDNWKVMYGPVDKVELPHVKFGKDIITNSGGTNVSIEWTTKWSTGLPMDIVVAICRYGAGLYAVRENMILSVNGVVHEPKNYMDEAQKMVMKWGNATFL
ncbi:head-tail connector protein [Sphingobacterium sp. UT-1RO-CII-1]|uniref:head-tail connector protein n=1 Tax=Sphingobacterium sp. UT-1RO-CII-1 TaxID=2995225 RepID=UPI00227D540D|nr:head-tail connector protein [Sphingobacterium sp. UT-1RO-CII-1]MCY4781705.1 head-tail connector protein [Sphingobacterium sp. UT-1RO-CII-1]